MEETPIRTPDEGPGEETGRKSSRTFVIAGIIVIILAVIGFMYHSITVKNREIEQLRQENLLGEEEQKKLNSYLNEITDTVSEVETKLRDVRTKQVTITNLITQAENDQSKKAALLNDISAIEDQLKKDRKDISDLQSRMKKSNVRIKVLEDMVTNLQTEITKNEKIMVELRASVDEKNRIIQAKELMIKSKDDTLSYTQKNLRVVSGELDQTNQILDETRNTGYYVIGAKKELIEKKAIEETGGFLQRKNLIIARELDASAFTKIHIAKVTEFPLTCPAKDVKLVPERGATSFQIEATGKDACVLKVLNTEQFWKMPYLAIIVKG